MEFTMDRPTVTVWMKIVRADMYTMCTKCKKKIAEGKVTVRIFVDDVEYILCGEDVTHCRNNISVPKYFRKKEHAMAVVRMMKRKVSKIDSQTGLAINVNRMDDGFAMQLIIGEVRL